MLTAGRHRQTSSSSARPSPREYGVVAGGTVEIRGETFEVVGTLQPTLTSPDTTAIVPLATAQELYLARPAAHWSPRRSTPGELANQIVVYPGCRCRRRRRSPRAIEAASANSATLTGAELDEQVGATTAIFNAIIIGVAAISLVVGGLSVINTMAMSVAERTREIGIKRAIGGSRRRIIRELVAEAGSSGSSAG